MSNHSQRIRRVFARTYGVRVRSTMVAVLVVGVGLLAGGAGLILLLENALEQNVRNTGLARATEVEALISADGPQVAAARLGEDAESGQLVQIVGPDGTVLGASSPAISQRPLVEDRPPVDEFTTYESHRLEQLRGSGEWMVVATTVAHEGRSYQVYVAIAAHVVHETVETVTTFALIGTPLLLAAVGLAVWKLVGRALGSVEGVRRAVATIDAQRLATRVDVPPTADEIAALATTMNGMLDRLQASHRAQRAFVSDASHELRSPLATLSTAAELATIGDELTRTRLLATINLELDRMRSLVENLMTLARADAEDLGGTAREVDLDDLVGDEVRRLSSTSSRHLVIEVQPAKIRGDGLRMTQAIRNLVDNAERHAATTVRLQLVTDHRWARLWVDNDGPIIAPQERERIFERFVRLDESRSRDAGGSGLGLAIARVAVRSHGGEVAVVDSPDGWCRFELRLPALPATESDHSAADIEEPR